MRRGDPAKWVRATFGKTVARTSINRILETSIDVVLVPERLLRRFSHHPRTEAELLTFVCETVERGELAQLTDDMLNETALRASESTGERCVSMAWIQRFEGRNGLRPSAYGVVSSGIDTWLLASLTKKRDDLLESIAAKALATGPSRAEQPAGTARLDRDSVPESGDESDRDQAEGNHDYTHDASETEEDVEDTLSPAPAVLTTRVGTTSSEALTASSTDASPAVGTIQPLRTPHIPATSESISQSSGFRDASGCGGRAPVCPPFWRGCDATRSFVSQLTTHESQHQPQYRRARRAESRAGRARGGAPRRESAVRQRAQAHQDRRGDHARAQAAAGRWCFRH